MTGALRFVLGDQLGEGLSALADIDRARDVVLMVEVAEETTYVRHHRQKIALVLAAMRHFAAGLSARGVAVDYVRLDDSGNTGTFGGELARAVARHRPERVILTEPGEWRVLEMMERWREEIDAPVEIREDTRFICSRARFAAWAQGRKSCRMEFFYREMRRETGLLMDGDAPADGRWNFDAENRKPLPKGWRPPPTLEFPPDAVTTEVIDLVRSRFADHFGDLDGFNWPVTRAGALRALDHFIQHSLPGFGDYQDAMRRGAPFVHHCLLSPALNLGLLSPIEVCRAAETAWRRGRAPLAATEGFVRQILGWREYVRGLYWRHMPDYARSNRLDAHRDLPAFYWTGDTDMACIGDVVGELRRNAYAHHIQRLMITGNFALLAGIEPAQVETWYLAVFADAFDWVELPNTHGMALFADGGLLASKPYAASGAYIDRMSDYCAGCRYDVKVKEGPDACPFNLLYWDFLIRNERRLAGNPRLAMPYRNLAKMPPARRAAIRTQSTEFLDRVCRGGADWRAY